MRFFVRNLTDVPVHVRLDEIDAVARNFKFTFSKQKVAGGRPLSSFVLATRMHMPVSWLDENADYVIDDRYGLTFDEHVDAQGDYVIDIKGFVH